MKHQRKTYVNDILQFFTFVLGVCFQRCIKIMADEDCLGVLCGSCIYVFCVCICDDRQHRSRDNQRVEVLFRPREGTIFSKFGIKIDKTSNVRDEENCDDCCCPDDCCNAQGKEDGDDCCCPDDCCNEGERLTTSSKIVSVTRGGLAESLGVQVGWGLEKLAR